MTAPDLTTAEVDYLVEIKKFVTAIPEIKYSHSADEDEMSAAVRKKDNPGEDIGLTIVARVSKPISGLPKEQPRCVLSWRGQRIRGLDYSVAHGRPGTAGGVVKGWHEHRWTQQEKDGYIVKANPEPNRKDLVSIFRWGLKKWNIEVKEEQLEAGRDN